MTVDVVASFDMVNRSVFFSFPKDPLTLQWKGERTSIAGVGSSK